MWIIRCHVCEVPRHSSVSTCHNAWDDVPFGAEKWMTFPSLLNMLTSSMAWMGWTLSFFSAVWSFLSSVPAALWTFLTFLRGVPLPLYIELASNSS